jgi:hypothetical protein
MLSSARCSSISSSARDSSPVGPDSDQSHCNSIQLILHEQDCTLEKQKHISCLSMFMTGLLPVRVRVVFPYFHACFPILKIHTLCILILYREHRYLRFLAFILGVPSRDKKVRYQAR